MTDGPTLEAIAAGLHDGEFFLEYMPTISLADGRCVGAEALTRWRRPSGVVQPGEFIGLVEGTHFSGTLTYWVFEAVARELGDWLRAHDDVHIGINVPPEILGRGALLYVTTKTGLSEIQNQIVIEVTERGIPDSPGANLAVLSRCAFDLIKTDKSLVDQITPDCPRPTWLAGLAALLQTTRLAVICEGVETAAQAQSLRESAIPMAQGYYFSHPLSADGLKAYYAAAIDRCGRR
jgi:sensor c-di-GMP phosphodiesterase-like protein